jgi:ribosomal protein L24
MSNAELMRGERVEILTGSLKGRTGDVFLKVASEWDGKVAYDVVVDGKTIRYAPEELRPAHTH